MAFANDEVGLERGATQLLLDREPRVRKRYQEGGPVRATAVSLPGTPISVEFRQDQDERELPLALENMTDAQATTLRTLLNGVGPLIVKIAYSTSDTITCTVKSHDITPIIGDHTENAPAQIRAHRAELVLLRMAP